MESGSTDLAPKLKQVIYGKYYAYLDKKIFYITVEIV